MATPKPATSRTTVNLPTDLKLAAQKLALDRGCDLQDLVALGLKLVLATERGAAAAKKGGAR